MRILCARSKTQLDAIDAAYRRKYETTLVRYIEKEMGGNLERFLSYAQMTEPEFDSTMLKQAFSGLGTDEDLVIEVLCTRPFSRLQAARYVLL